MSCHSSSYKCSNSSLPFLQSIDDSHSTPHNAMAMQQTRYNAALEHCQYRPYGLDYSVGKGSRRQTSPGPGRTIKRRPDMQSCRLVSGSSSYGKDRDSSKYSQEQIDYPNITHSAMVSNGGKRRLTQESNVPELTVDRRPGKMVYTANPMGGCSNNARVEKTVGLGACSAEPLMSSNNVPQSYSTIPLGGSISPACKTCHSGTF